MILVKGKAVPALNLSTHVDVWSGSTAPLVRMTEIGSFDEVASSLSLAARQASNVHL
jgi:hypothetical protein